MTARDFLERLADDDGSVSAISLDRDAVEDILRPDWRTTSRVHDWRNHVPHELRELWTDLNEDARLAVYLMAERRADGEEWE